MSRTLPMFPLGGVLLPYGLLPLHVFEPRYRALVDDVLAGDREFGVVLIERGSEVGGGDVRTDLGTVARVLETERFPDGRWALLCAGTRRVRVTSWLADDPYPRAEVDDVLDTAATDDAAVLVADAEPKLRRLLALRSEAGEASAPLDVSLDDDPAVASWQLALLAGLGPLDAHAVLAADGPDARLRLLSRLLDEQVEALQFRLS